MSKKRPRPVPDWDDYFMMLTFFVASRSKDPSTQIGAVIADSRHRIVSTGYNGLPAAIPDTDIDWGRPHKYPFIVHAEENALATLRGDHAALDGATLYVSGPPCSRCTRTIIAHGIRKIVYGPQPAVMVDEEDMALSRELVRLAKSVEMSHYAGNLNWLRDWIDRLDRQFPDMMRPQRPIPIHPPAG